MNIPGTGATCGTCGFRYREHNGHIIPCPLCALATARKDERKRCAATVRARELLQEVADGMRDAYAVDGIWDGTEPKAQQDYEEIISVITALAAVREMK
jgi:uncharacterized Zn finger protein (UPF0148 family)